MHLLVQQRRHESMLSSGNVGVQQVKNAASGTAQEASKQSGWTQKEIQAQAASTWQAVTTSFEGTWADVAEYVDAAAGQVQISGIITAPRQT